MMQDIIVNLELRSVYIYTLNSDKVQYTPSPQPTIIYYYKHIVFYNLYFILN